MAKKNPTPEQILNELDQYSREPFLRVLADIMGRQPSLPAIQRFANKSPDRWAQAVAILARLGGYSEQIQVTQNVYLHVQQMSDMELDNEREALQRQIAKLEAKQDGGRLIEQIETFEPVEDDDV